MESVTGDMPRPPRIDTLDGLRALAALAVMLFHLWQQSWFDFNPKIAGWVIPLEYFPITGFMGVELFFFISGFCLYYPYARAVSLGEPWPSVRMFFFRRAIKILPSYLFALGFAVLLLEPKSWPAQGIWHSLTHLTFIHNLFPETQMSLMTVFWTLAVEVQFYLVFPAIALAYRRWPWQVLALSFSVGALYRFAALTYHSTWFSSYSIWLPFYYHQLPSFIELFVGGMAASHLHVAHLRWDRTRLKRVYKIAPVLFLSSVFALNSLLYYLYANQFGPNDLMSRLQMQNEGVLTVFLLGLVLTAPYAWRPLRFLLSNRVALFFSTISYNLYLWHHTVGLQLMRFGIPHPSTKDPHDDPVWKLRHLCFAIAGSIVLATLLTFLIERPILRWGARYIRRRSNLMDEQTPKRPTQDAA